MSKETCYIYIHIHVLTSCAFQTYEGPAAGHSCCSRSGVFCVCGWVGGWVCVWGGGGGVYIYQRLVKVAALEQVSVRVYVCGGVGLYLLLSIMFVWGCGGVGVWGCVGVYIYI